MTEDKRLPWFPCEPTALLGALNAMPPDQQIVYFTVLLRIYEVGGPMPDTLDALCRRTGLNKRRVTDALAALYRAEKLHQDPDGIMNRKAAAVLAEMRGRRGKAKQAGKEGAAKRWGKSQPNQSNGHGEGIATPMPDDAHLQLQLQSIPPKGGIPGPKAKGTSKRSRIPADWTLSHDDQHYAELQGFTLIKITQMADSFLNFHKSRGSLMVDWRAAWRTWVLNEVKFSQRRGGPPGGSGRGPTFADIARGDFNGR